MVNLTVSGKAAVVRLKFVVKYFRITNQRPLEVNWCKFYKTGIVLVKIFRFRLKETIERMLLHFA